MYQIFSVFSNFLECVCERAIRYTSVCLGTLQPLDAFTVLKMVDCKFSAWHIVGHLQANVWQLALCVWVGKGVCLCRGRQKLRTAFLSCVKVISPMQKCQLSLFGSF